MDAHAPAQGVDPDELLAPADVSAWTRLALQTLANMRHRNAGPAYIKLGSSRGAPVRYRRSDVASWIAANRVEAA